LIEISSILNGIKHRLHKSNY